MLINQQEYLERLVNLMPPDTFVTNQQLSFGKPSILSSTQMVEAISEEIYNRLSDFVETDQVVDMKDALRNLMVLGQFLSIVYYEVLENPRNV